MKGKPGFSGGSKKVGGEDEIENKFRLLIKELKSTGSQFTDKAFPPEPESLIEDWNSKSKVIREISEEWKQFRWIRSD